MANRPLSITVIAWFSIVVGALSLASDFITLTGLTTHESIGRAAVPIPIQHAMALTGGAVSLMCGYFLLHGKNWAQWLFVIWYTIQHEYGLLVYPISLARIPGIIIFLVFTYFLYRAQASAYFAWTGTPAETQERISARQAFGIFCYFVAGFLLSGTCLVGFAVAPGDGANSGSYDFLAKMAFLCTFSVPSLLLFLIGKASSPDRSWRKDIGIVLTTSAVVGAISTLTLQLRLMDPEFQKTLSPEKLESFSDCTAGIVWITLMGALGGWALSKSPKRIRFLSHQNQNPSRDNFIIVSPVLLAPSK